MTRLPPFHRCPPTFFVVPDLVEADALEAMGVIECRVSDGAAVSRWKQAGAMIQKRLAYIKALAKETKGCVAWAYMKTGGSWKAELYDEQAFDEAGNLEQSDDWTTYAACTCIACSGDTYGRSTGNPNLPSRSLLAHRRYLDHEALQKAFEGRQTAPCRGKPVVLVPGLASTKLRVEKSGLKPEWEGHTLFMDVRKLVAEAALTTSGTKQHEAR